MINKAKLQSVINKYYLNVNEAVKWIIKENHQQLKTNIIFRIRNSIDKCRFPIGKQHFSIEILSFYTNHCVFLWTLTIPFLLPAFVFVNYLLARILLPYL